uniref:Uncharacterized protein n=1 Tax=Arundo donax TaxID=35708 RepID=A0A0A8XPJ1_ARUDO
MVISELLMFKVNGVEEVQGIPVTLAIVSASTPQVFAPLWCRFIMFS